ncbi:MAG TPA: vitamin K epoxide reductase family protein [Minicystis sp.]|nr:vitamin K epoxide reductase family protein [Minicystis sp.]
MRLARPLVLLRLPLLVAITASAALLIEYQNAGDPAFCSAVSGCMKVRMSPYSRLFGVPLPFYGLAAYGALYTGSLLARTKLHHRLLAAVAAVGGVAGIALVAIQGAAVGAFCKWCVTVDTSAVVAAGLAAWLAVRTSRDPATLEAVADVGKAPLLGGAWALLGALAIGLPFLWARYPVVPALPRPIQALEVPGKLNIVSFTDFQCPFCRKLHKDLDAVREENPGRVHFVRLMVPLPGHAAAMPAALAWECVPPAKQDAVATALYETPPGQLAAAARAIALRFGADADAFDRCVADPATRAKVEHDIALFKEVEGAGLPLTYVNDRLVVGSDARRLRSVAEIGLAPKGPELPVPLMWIVLGIAYVAASATTLRARRPAEAAA